MALTRLVEPGLCRYCSDTAPSVADAVTYLADADGPLHPCCKRWADDLAAGKPCLSCSESRRFWRSHKGGR